MMDDGFEQEEEPYQRSWATRTIALVLVLSLAGTYAGLNLYSALRRNRAITPAEAAVDPRGFKFLSLDPATKTPVRYDPCSPLHYVINPASAPKGGIKDIHEAVAITSEATGISFAYDGETTEPLALDRELVQRELYGDRWAPLLIGWIPFDSTIFDLDDVGVAGSAIERNARDRLVFVSGTVILNGADQLDNGFRPGQTWGKVILHELGHVLGLDHVQDPAQVMHANLVSSPGIWGAGDLAGLTLLGTGAGCLALPEVP